MIVVSSAGTTAFTFSLKKIRQIAEYVCEREKVNKAEFSFVFVGDTFIQKINKQFLRHNFVTDVITFPLEAKNINAEIYINIQQARRQAKEFSVTFYNEIIRLIVHGILHAIGYSDTTLSSKKKNDDTSGALHSGDYQKK